MQIDNENVIIILCSHLCVGENVKPLEPKEWTDLAQKLYINNKEPKDLLDFTDEEFIKILNFDNDMIGRIKRLINRSGSLFFELEELNRLGIKIVTRASKEYPRLLKKNLDKMSPPLFYYGGDLNLLNNKFIGFVGSRAAEEQDVGFTKNMIDYCVNNGYGIVSGGAKGVDSVATIQAITKGGIAVEYLSDSMIKKLKNPEIINAVRNNKLVLISSSKPDAGFNVGIAMQRNKYIYAQSSATIVVRTEYESGGTWAGAIENLKNKWCLEFCWDNLKYKGNKALISKGAIPINSGEEVFNALKNMKVERTVQTSLFDTLDE